MIAQTSRGKEDLVRQAGAAEVLDRAAEGVPGRVRDLTPDGLDAVVDVVAGPQVDALLPLVRDGGRWIVAGAVADPVVQLDLRRLYLGNRRIVGSTMHTPGPLRRAGRGGPERVVEAARRRDVRSGGDPCRPTPSWPPAPTSARSWSCHPGGDGGSRGRPEVLNAVQRENPCCQSAQTRRFHGVRRACSGKTVAPAGYNRWLIPPAALAIHLCIGQVYATSVYKNSLVEHFDTSLTTSASSSPSRSSCSGLSAAVFGTWVDTGGPTSRDGGLDDRSGPPACSSARPASRPSSCGCSTSATGSSAASAWASATSRRSPRSSSGSPTGPGLATGMAIMGFGGGALVAARVSAASCLGLRQRLRPHATTSVASGRRRRHAVPDPGHRLPRRHAVRRLPDPGPGRRLEARRAGTQEKVEGNAMVTDRVGLARTTRSGRRSSGCSGSCCSATSPPASASSSRPRR